MHPVRCLPISQRSTTAFRKAKLLSSRRVASCRALTTMMSPQPCQTYRPSPMSMLSCARRGMVSMTATTAGGRVREVVIGLRSYGGWTCLLFASGISEERSEIFLYLPTGCLFTPCWLKRSRWKKIASVPFITLGNRLRWTPSMQSIGKESKWISCAGQQTSPCRSVWWGCRDNSWICDGFRVPCRCGCRDAQSGQPIKPPTAWWSSQRAACRGDGNASRDLAVAQVLVPEAAYHLGRRCPAPPDNPNTLWSLATPPGQMAVGTITPPSRSTENCPTSTPSPGGPV